MCPSVTMELRGNSPSGNIYPIIIYFNQGENIQVTTNAYLYPGDGGIWIRSNDPTSNGPTGSGGRLRAPRGGCPGCRRDRQSSCSARRAGSGRRPSPAASARESALPAPGLARTPAQVPATDATGGIGLWLGPGHPCPSGQSVPLSVATSSSSVAVRWDCDRGSR